MRRRTRTKSLRLVASHIAAFHASSTRLITNSDESARKESQEKDDEGLKQCIPPALIIVVLHNSARLAPKLRSLTLLDLYVETVDVNEENNLLFTHFHAI